MSQYGCVPVCYSSHLLGECLPQRGGVSAPRGGCHAWGCLPGGNSLPDTPPPWTQNPDACENMYLADISLTQTVMTLNYLGLPANVNPPFDRHVKFIKIKFK